MSDGQQRSTEDQSDRHSLQSPFPCLEFISTAEDISTEETQPADLMVWAPQSDLEQSVSFLPRSIPFIPTGTIPEDDILTINVYFDRHPFELVIGPEFVDEMNASVLMVLQDNPTAIGDALYSIGRVYLDEEVQTARLPLALDRRAKTLARLKAKDPTRELEQMLLMTLTLGAMEVSSLFPR